MWADTELIASFTWFLFLDLNFEIYFHAEQREEKKFECELLYSLSISISIQNNLSHFRLKAVRGVFIFKTNRFHEHWVGISLKYAICCFCFENLISIISGAWIWYTSKPQSLATWLGVFCLDWRPEGMGYYKIDARASDGPPLQIHAIPTAC